ncbi:MAG: VWA domain-containing protein [Bdellovibrionota bacterium]
MDMRLSICTLNIITLGIVLSSCNDSADFSSRTPTKKQNSEKLEVEQASDSSFDSNPTFDPNAPNNDSNSNQKTKSEDDPVTSIENTENKDGSITEKFIGRLRAETNSKVDLVFAVDTSDSMDAERSMLAQNLTQFLRELSAENKIDYQLLSIGGGVTYPADADQSRFGYVGLEVDSDSALARFRQLLGDPQKYSKLPFREDASKELVVVTDDNSGVTGLDFLNFLYANAQRMGTLHFNGFIGLENSVDAGKGGPSWCGIRRIGSEYLAIEKDPKYGGKMFDLCTADWSKLLKDLANRIVRVNAQSEFVVTKGTIDSSNDIKVSINGVDKIREEEWVLNVDKNMIVFKPEHAPKSGEVVTITYQMSVKS